MNALWSLTESLTPHRKFVKLPHLSNSSLIFLISRPFQVEIVDASVAVRVAEEAQVLTNVAFTLTVTDINITARLIGNVAAFTAPGQAIQRAAVS